ncbi:MAG: NAD(P)H-dependent oxidoreductase subunit E [Desulfobacterales bacterium]|nr:NAD(P)H-dependent oxidoreductase subunit E [Desulfobacterales bacterium]
MNALEITAEAGPEWTRLDAVLEEWRGRKGAVIPVLQRAQAIFGYLPPEVLRRVATGLRAPLGRVFGVATFYSQFYLTRRGRHIVRRRTTASPARWSTAWAPAGWRRWPWSTSRRSVKSYPRGWPRC